MKISEDAWGEITAGISQCDHSIRHNAAVQMTPVWPLDNNNAPPIATSVSPSNLFQNFSERFNMNGLSSTPVVTARVVGPASENRSSMKRRG